MASINQQKKYIRRKKRLFLLAVSTCDVSKLTTTDKPDLGLSKQLFHGRLFFSESLTVHVEELRV